MLYLLGQLRRQSRSSTSSATSPSVPAARPITALLFVFLFGPAIIARCASAGQGTADPRRRAADPSSTKAGTPTMGGLMILSGILVSTLLWANLANVYVWVVLASRSASA